jgi:hypothetical protein
MNNRTQIGKKWDEFMGVRNERGRKNRIYHQGRNGKGFA